MRVHVNAQFWAKHDRGESPKSNVRSEHWNFGKKSDLSFHELAMAIIVRLADFFWRVSGLTEKEMNAEIERLAEAVLAMRRVKVEG